MSPRRHEYDIIQDSPLYDDDNLSRDKNYNDDDHDDDGDNDNDPRHEILKRHPTLWAFVGVTQTLLTSGIIFGWASLLPVLRQEGVNHTPQAFSTIFTAGAVGNYLSTLFFGFIVDRFGPRITGITAALMFGLGLFLSSLIHNYWCLAIGFALLGFAGPGIQMPTLHLANLFKSSNSSSNNSKNNANDDEDEDDNDNQSNSSSSSGGGGGGGGGGAVYMSAQAAAFDGGTAIFAIQRLIFQATGLSASIFLRLYMVIPTWVLLTSIFVWPDDILEDERASKDNQQLQETYVGPGSPYLSPRGSNKKKKRCKSNNNTTSLSPPPQQQSLINSPLSIVLRHPAFWSLAIWVSIHILKLNFIVATINDQLHQHVSEATALHLIDVFGAMLPFGFVVLPIVAWLLDKSATLALQLANIVGLAYGAVLVFFPASTTLQTFVVFPSVATSRQLVYSTIFHQVGELFGFANYGVLLGLCNLCVSTISMVQTPLVNWSEQVGSYKGANTLLWVITMPLLVLVLWSNPSSESSSTSNAADNNDGSVDMGGGETSPLKTMMQEAEASSPTRRYSAV